MVDVLSAMDFQRLRREKRLEYAHYFEEADDLTSTFQRARRNLADPIWLSEKDEGQKLLAASAGARYAVDFLTLSYSAGCDLAKLRALYPSIVEAWRTHERFHHAYDQCPEGASSQAATYALLGDAFHIVNRMVCLGILLGWGELLPSVARIIEYKNPRMDGMLEHMLSHYVPDRDTTITGCTRHRPYFGTLKIFSSPVNARPAMMAEYLEDWYRASSREPYYESHTRGPVFKGYWSWEAAAITFLLDIDDSGYRNAEFYPADLVDFARHAKCEGITRNHQQPGDNNQVLHMPGGC